jgi:hypothetical protein
VHNLGIVTFVNFFAAPVVNQFFRLSWGINKELVSERNIEAVKCEANGLMLFQRTPVANPAVLSGSYIKMPV